VLKRKMPPRIDDLCPGIEVPSGMPLKTMNISLTPELKAAVESRVRSGRYGNASDVIRAFRRRTQSKAVR